MRRLRRATIVVHRYLGLSLATVFVTWFVSGIGMIFTGGMPSLTEPARLNRLPALDFSRVTVAPADVPDADRDGMVLTSVIGRPAYRLGPAHVVFADTGEAASPAAATIAADFLGLPASVLRDEEELSVPDQWTLTERRRLPLRKFSVDDRDGTQLYVSEREGEVVLVTTRRTRTLAWLSAIPHWFYFAPLRTHGALWRQVVLWSSALGGVLVVAGLSLAVLQWRPRRPRRVSRMTTWHPYSGWMRWHYVLGAVVGVFALTWVVSGWLSMQPGDWAAPAVDAARVQRALTGETSGVAELPEHSIDDWRLAFGSIGAREVVRLHRLGSTYIELRTSSGDTQLFDAATFRERHTAFPVDAIVQAVRDGTGGILVLDVTSLDRYDNYYYARQNERSLPVVRVKLADPEETWIYIDPLRADVVGVYSRRGRLERWIYHGLHSLDVSFLYRRPWLWAIVVGALCAAGAALSASGLVVGGRRLLRNPHAGA